MVRRASLSLMLTVFLLLSSIAFAQTASIRTPDVSAVVGAPKETALRGKALDEKTKAVASRLRCPVCQGLSIADSPATMAVDMKGEVQTLLAAGFSEEQILRYFEHSYGEFVLLDPPKRGINWLVWLLPLLMLIGGGWLIRATLRSKSAPTSIQEESVDDELEPWIRRVREIAYGEKGK